nr:MAG TPA: hypothetical protein [Caudoviricetes sp.]
MYHSKREMSMGRMNKDVDNKRVSFVDFATV